MIKELMINVIMLTIWNASESRWRSLWVPLIGYKDGLGHRNMLGVRPGDTKRYGKAATIISVAELDFYRHCIPPSMQFLKRLWELEHTRNVEVWPKRSGRTSSGSKQFPAIISGFPGRVVDQTSSYNHLGFKMKWKEKKRKAEIGEELMMWWSCPLEDFLCLSVAV